MYRRLVLGIFVCAIFLIRFTTYEHVHHSKIPDDWFGKKITITTVITGDPNRGLSATKITLGEYGILATVQNGEKFFYGDKISVTGLVKHPENFMTDTGREFDYVNYLKVHDIYGIMSVSRIEIVSRHNKNLFIEHLFHTKKFFVDTIKNLFPKNEAGLLAGIVVGEKSLLPEEVLSEFQIAGLTHMVVLSGYNITIVVTVLAMILAYTGLGYRSRRVGAIFIIPIFLIMTGLGASSVRAGIMSILVLLLQITTRPSHSLRIILYTAAIMIFANPRILLHDPSFHMSFIAFIGLVYVTPLLEKIFKARNFVIETLAVQIFVLPYILWMSGRISLLLLVANVLTVPLVPFIMGLGFCVTIVGIASYSLGSLLAIPIKLGLTYIIWIAHMVALVEAVTFTIPPFGVWIMLGTYGLLIWVLVRNATMNPSSLT